MEEAAAIGKLFAVADGDGREKASLSLLEVHFFTFLLGLNADVDLQQTYRNDFEHPVELTYVFPMAEGASIIDFSARVGGKKVRGVVKEKGEAAAEYDTALAAGHRAYLLSRGGSRGIQIVHLGNVSPGEQVEIRVRFALKCDVAEDGVTFKLPTTMKERYTVTRGLPTRTATATLQNGKPEFSEDVTTRLTMRFEAFMSGEVTGVFSPTHDLLVTMDQTDQRHVTATFDSKAVAMDRDVIVRVKHVGMDKPFAFLSPPDEAGDCPAAMVSFVPRYEEDLLRSEKREIIFLVDCSGSMEYGDNDGLSPMEQCKDALNLFLRSLPESCTFNIVKFGSTYVKLFPESQPYTGSTLPKAVQFVQAMQPDLGGTEILEPLVDILRASQVADDMPRQVFILTDGAVSNTDAVIQVVRNNAHTTRVSAFGVGDSVAEDLVRGVARAGLGEACFIRNGEAIDKSVIEQLGKCLMPCLEKVNIDWGGLNVLFQSPPADRLPPAYNGFPYTVFAVLAPDSPHHARVSLSGRLKGRPVSSVMQVSPFGSKSVDARAKNLQKIAVLHHLRDLEDAEDDMWKERIVKLSTRWQVMSKYTSFVAVAQREEAVQGTLVSMRVPLASMPSLPAYNRAFSGDEDGVIGGFTAESALERDFSDDDMDESGFVPVERGLGTSNGYDDEVEMEDALPAAKEAESPAFHSQELLQKIASLQEADGSWRIHELSVLLLHLVKADEFSAIWKFDETSRDREVLATVLALVCLHVFCSSQQSVYTLMERKARRWLMVKGRVSPAQVDEILAEGESFVRQHSNTPESF